MRLGLGLDEIPVVGDPVVGVMVVGDAPTSLLVPPHIDELEELVLVIVIRARVPLDELPAKLSARLPG